MSDDLRYDILNRKFLAFQREVRQLLTQTTLGNSSITRGRLRVASNEGLLVQGSQKVEGWLVVTGTERVTGTLEILGRLIASGAIELSGNTDITGPTNITGDTDITGRLRASGAVELNGPTKITGDVDLIGLLKLAQGGRISIGDIILSEEDGGSLRAPVQVIVNTPLTDLLGGLHVTQGAVFDAGITAPGLTPIPISSAPEGAFLGAVFRDGNDRLRVVTP